MLGPTGPQQNGHQDGDWNVSTTTQNNSEYLTGAKVSVYVCFCVCGSD